MVSGSNVPNQEGPGKPQLGYSLNVEGVPLPEEEGFTQQADSSATPNRTDTDFNVKGDLESDYARDYFDAEEERLGDPLAEASGAEPSETWSEGIEDEANPIITEQNDDVNDQNALPEMQPMDLVEQPSPEQLDPGSSDRYITEP